VLLRHEFILDRPIASATLYATAQGVYQAHLNGVAVDNHVLKPGWTPYRTRLVHESTDVTELLRAGPNAVAVELAGGWFCERFGWGPGSTYGDQPAFAAQLHIEFADGSRVVHATGDRWRVWADGPIVASGIYQGETVDLRREPAGWRTPEFDDSAWSTPSVAPVAPIPGTTTLPPTRVTEVLPVIGTFSTPSGATIVDFGQNLVGCLRLRVTGPAGHTIRIRHAEVLEAGELGTRPLRAAAATDELTLDGTGEVNWQPRFTFHGFRYAEIEGWPGPLDPDHVEALVIHSDLRRTGWFESSHPLLNRFHENVVWSMRGNFLALPTDCPQRDERLGWTADIQLFAPTACFLFDSEGFLASWMRDLRQEQDHLGGVVPLVVPDVLGAYSALPVAAWGDAATIVPTVLHESYGDLALLRYHFPGMVAWLRAAASRVGGNGLWTGDFQFGDWLDPLTPPDEPGAARTDPDLVANAYLIHSADLVAATARILDEADVEAEASTLAGELRSAFATEFRTPSGRLMSDTQTAYSLALAFRIIPEAGDGERFATRLAELVRLSAFRLRTGFVGTPIILAALAGEGHVDVAAHLLLQTTNPSWLYPVTMGATTTWERWDSMLPDGTINPGQMTSFNHYAFGAVAAWLHRGVAGLAPEAPGYRRILIEPTPLPGLDHATARHETPLGVTEAGWATEPDGRIRVHAVIPPNAQATVRLPGRDPIEIGSGHHTWLVADPRSPKESRNVSGSSTLIDLAENPPALDIVEEALRSESHALVDALRLRVRSMPRLPLDAFLIRTDESTRRAIAIALRKLRESRSSTPVEETPWT